MLLRSRPTNCTGRLRVTLVIMKYCPECKKAYDDNTLNFCLEDGTILVKDLNADEHVTAVLPSSIEPPTRYFPADARVSEPQPSFLSRTDKRLMVLVPAVVFIASALAYQYFWSSRVPTGEIDSIAVMPFVNESGNPDFEHLSDGMAESLIGSLSRLPKLNVKARSAVFRYKGRNIEPKQIGMELNVQAVLNGRVIQRGDQITLGLELVDAKTENVIWSEQYNRKQTDLIALQSDIARDVADKLRVKLSGAEESRVTKRYTEDREAYELYLKGRYFSGGAITEEGVMKSIDHFRRAIERDPNYALAHVGLGLSYMRLGHVWGFQPPRETFPKAKPEITKALAIDDSLPEAHTALADYLHSYEWDWAGAEREYKRAIELNPNDATPYSGYGTYFQSMGQLEEAAALRKQARDLDPLSPTATANAGYPYYYARQYDTAISHFQKALELDPNYSWSYLWIGQAQLQQKKFDEAIAEIKKAIDMSAGNIRMTATLGYAYAIAGKRAEAEKIISRLKDESKRRYVSPYFIATVYAGLDEKDLTFEWLEKAYDERHPYMTLIKVEPVFDSVRSDSRFQDLLRRLALPA
jgi:adenylate cyclase